MPVLLHRVIYVYMNAAKVHAKWKKTVSKPTYDSYLLTAKGYNDTKTTLKVSSNSKCSR
jgi:hypothetical protein